MIWKKEKAYISKSTGNQAKFRTAMDQRRRSVGKNLSFAASEAYKLLRTNLMFSMADESACKVIGVTSALRGEGKSTTSMNLAYSLAESGKKTLLVEADMRIPVVSAVLKIKADPGLSHVLAGLEHLDSAVRSTELSRHLFVLPAGKIPPNPSELLSSNRMEAVLEKLARSYEYIIIDLPPINAVSDGLAVSKLLSGMIMVVRQDYCNQRDLAEAMRHLNFLKVKLLGFVLNGANTQSKRYRYGNRNQYKKYQESNYGYGYSHSHYAVEKSRSEQPDRKEKDPITSFTIPLNKN